MSLLRSVIIKSSNWKPLLTLFQSGGCILNPPHIFCFIEVRKYRGYAPVMIIVRAELTQQSNKELFNTEQTLTFGSQPWSCNLWCKVGSSPIEGFHFERRKVPSINNDISFPKILTTHSPLWVEMDFMWKF